MSGRVFVASVVSRKDWTCDIHLVGHENTVAVAAFSPRLFRNRDDPTSSCTVIALGSVDQSVSVWITGQSRPILVARDVFQRQVMDLSWSSDGLTLYACSADGHIAAFVFTTEDLMELHSNSELRSAKEVFGFSEQQKIFKQSTLQQSAPQSQLNSAPGTAERPAMLVARKAGVPQVKQRSQLGVPAPANGRVQRLDQQITITNEGKRRIRPTLLNEGGSSDSDFELVSHSQSMLPPPASSQRSMSRVEASEPPDNQIGESSLSRGIKRTASLSFSHDGDLQMGSSSNGVKKIKDVGRTLGGDLNRSAAGPAIALRQQSTFPQPHQGESSSHLHLLPSPDLLSVYRREEGHGTIEARNFESHREFFCVAAA